MCWRMFAYRRAGVVRVSAPRFVWDMVKRVPCTRVLRSGRIRVLVSPRAQMQGRPAPRDTRAREPWNGGRAELGSTWGWRARKPGVWALASPRLPLAFVAPSG